jgi:glycosyltransferase involved in cell wall biosynthesis
VLIGVRGEATSLVAQARAGLPFQPESPSSLAEAAEVIATMPEGDRRAMGERARQYYSDRLSFDRGVAAMLRVYDATVRGERK